MSDTLSFDPWMPVSKDDPDPLCQDGEPYCEGQSPCQGFICTREPGHPGLHVASYSNGLVCCDSWGITPQQRLPEGF